MSLSNEPIAVDISAAPPELQRLAEDVHASKQPRRLQKDGQTIAVVMPVASRLPQRRKQTTLDEEVSTVERVETTLTLPPPPSPEEIARRQGLLKQILANRERRAIAPLTSADLVHEAREDEYRSNDDRR